MLFDELSISDEAEWLEDSPDSITQFLELHVLRSNKIEFLMNRK